MCADFFFNLSFFFETSLYYLHDITIPLQIFIEKLLFGQYKEDIEIQEKFYTYQNIIPLVVQILKVKKFDIGIITIFIEATSFRFTIRSKASNEARCLMYALFIER